MARSSGIKVMMEVQSAAFLPRADEIIVPKQQHEAIERSIALRAEALITARAKLSPTPVLRGDSLVAMPPYSRNRISMPTTRLAGGRSGERSAVRRNRFARRMSQAKGRSGTRVSTAGRGPRGKREWITTDRGYEGIRQMAGIPGNQYFAFTGKMLEDFRVDATLAVNKRAVTYLGDLVTGAINGFRIFGAEGLRSTGGRFAAGSRAIREVVGGSDRPISPPATDIPLYTVRLDFGFATQASARIARFLHNPGYKSPPRPWVGLARHEALELQAAAERILSEAASDSRFDGGTAETTIRQPRGSKGTFVPFVY